jgi:hypothetical protein
MRSLRPDWRKKNEELDRQVEALRRARARPSATQVRGCTQCYALRTRCPKHVRLRQAELDIMRAATHCFECRRLRGMHGASSSQYCADHLPWMPYLKPDLYV